ncbi:MAG: translation initiation factor IF-2 [Clostridia bacterium]|nr:translation initiation factor IF-2 [Clostridia bacterium]
MKSGADFNAIKTKSADLKRKMGEILKKLDEKEKEFARIKKEQAEKELAEAAEKAKVEQEAKAAAEKEAKKQAEEAAKAAAEKAKAEAAEKAKAEAAEKAKAEAAEKAKAEAAEKAKAEAAAQEKPAAKPAAEKTVAEKPAAERESRPTYNAEQRPQRPTYNNGERPTYTGGERPQRPYGDRPQNNNGERPQRPYGDRPQYSNGERPQRPYGDRPQYNNGERPQRPYGDRPQYNNGDRPQRPYGDRPTYTGGERPQRPYGDRPQRPFGDKDQGAATPRPMARPARPAGGMGKPDMVAFPKESTKSFGPAKKKADGKTYDDKKNTVSKRALISRELTIEDFDDKESGYRKLRVKKAKTKQVAPQIKIEKAVINTEIIPLKVLSEKLGITAVEITKRLFKEGIIKTINDTVDYDTAGFIAADLGIELELQLDKTAEDILNEAVEEKDATENTVKRPPVISVMGHVDHGKTSLLDRIRHANIAEGEAGGITQHIGAYTVTVKGEAITFLDTPGHEAFTAMRMRGAQATDIAVIVIAADDGIMPQTVESINHAKAAGVSIVVACNKIDKPTANLNRVKQELTEHGILIEEWGGDVMFVPVSAKTGEGVDTLLDNLILLAEVKELRCNPERKAKGVIIEAKLDKGKGPMATVLVQNGTLKTGDNIVAGTVVGRVRAMIDDKGRTVKEAKPATAVSVLGLEDVPNTGDSLIAVEEEKLTKLVAEERRNKEREAMIHNASKVTLEDVFKQDIKSLNIIVKADVQGSVEAVKQSLVKLSNDEIKISVIHAAAGAITESDVMLAQSSKAIIIGFNVRPDSKAKVMAERSGVDVKLYRIIYEAIEDVERALKGMLAPRYEDVLTGKAEVRDTFRITGVGTVAGCYVIEGKMVREGKLRIYRNDVMICEGAVRQLKRFKDDVKEVATGYECGISIENFNDIKNDDIIECYITKEQQ